MRRVTVGTKISFTTRKLNNYPTPPNFLVKSFLFLHNVRYGVKQRRLQREKRSTEIHSNN